jgi:hypothetical protein
MINKSGLRKSAITIVMGTALACAASAFAAPVPDPDVVGRKKHQVTAQKQQAAVAARRAQRAAHKQAGTPAAQSDAATAAKPVTPTK